MYTVNSYIPKGPYVFRSGKNEGKAAEVLMFTNYGLLRYILEKSRRESECKKNKLHLHLEWLMERGEKITAPSTCPHCKQKPITRISVIGNEREGYTMGFNYTCCDSGGCLEKVKHLAGGRMPQILPVKFSSLAKFRKKTDQQQLAKLLRDIFQLPARMSKEHVFNLLAQN